MTETSQVWDGILTGDATVAPYSALEWAAREKLLHNQGTIFPNFGVFEGSGDGTNDPLEVRAKSPASTNVEVEIGAALVNGRLYENTTALTFTIGANTSGNPRIDTVLLRVDYVAQTVRGVVKQGTPAGSPARPTLQQDTSIWEMPLADVAVANGFSVINPADISNRRQPIGSLTKGWLPYAYPLSYNINSDHTGTSIIVSSSSGIAIPFMLPANLLLHGLTIRNNGGLTATAFTWGIYKQDVNDGNTAENTLRRIYFSDNGNVNMAGGNNELLANSGITVLPSGLYWLVMKNANASAFSFAKAAAVGTFNQLDSYQDHAGPTLGQTLDMVTGWTHQNGSIAVRMNGRVFGQTTKF